MFSRALDRVEHFLFPRQRTSDRTLASRKPRPLERYARNIKMAQRFGIGAMSVALVLAFIYAVNYYSTTRIRIQRNELVTNLTKAGLTGAAMVGESPLCDGRECWTLASHDDSAWTSVRVPMALSKAVSTLPGYEGAKPSASVYYRLRIPVTAEQMRQKDEIAFTPVYINHTRFSIYLNGRLVAVGNGASNLGSTTNISLPRGDVVDGVASVVVKGSLENDLPGLASRADAYVGPKPLLDEIYVHAERANGTYHLLFLLSKGGIFVVFTLFFIFSTGQRGLYSFLVFAFFSTIENLFIGDFLWNALTDPTVLDAGLFMAKIIATNALLAYLATSFDIHCKARFLRVVAIASVLIMTALVVTYSSGSSRVSFDHLLAAANLFTVLTVSFGLIVGTITLRMWRGEGLPRPAIRSLRNLLVFLGIYFALLNWELAFNTFTGFDKRSLFDLLLFYYMAFNTARDLGHKEGQVRRLEEHMIDKRRMELELQEAAEITRVFMPHSLPAWQGFEIRSYHHPLTENSGDWFAFESARERKLHHFVMCDITGHGVQAAIVVSACKTALSLIVQSVPEHLERTDFIAYYAKALNRLLHRHGEGNHISTILGLTFDAESGVLHFAAGGHPPPLYVAAATQPPKPLALTSRNTVLGAAPEIEITMSSRTLSPGDTVIAYTDGLPLAPNVKVVREFLANGGLEPSDALHNLYDRVWQAQKSRTGSGPDDDVSIVSFRLDAVATKKEGAA